MNVMVDPPFLRSGNAQKLDVLLPSLGVVGCRSVIERDALAQAKILVVGPDIEFRNYLSLFLSQYWSVAAANTGIQALDLIRQQRFDLVLTEAKIPDFEGTGFLHALHSLPVDRYCPVVMLIADPEEANEQLSSDFNPDDYLIKGFSPQFLRTRIEAHLRSALIQQAVEDNKAKDDFIAILGHELRNTLSPILSALQISRIRGDISQETVIVERQVGNLTRLVDDLLDVSRMVNGKMALRKETFEIAEAVAEGVEMVGPLLKLKRHSLYLDIPSKGLPIYGDRCRLAQVISNLLTNAGKYSEPGSRIDVLVKKQAQFLEIHVRDEGVGIAPNMLQRIFDLFVQQGQGTQARGGLGLGLAIVQRLVEMHGGTVTAKSEGQGKGAEFVVSLPLFLDHQQIDSAAQKASASDQIQENPMAQQKSRHVLIVDDAADAASLTAQLLEMNGFQVSVAHDAQSALDIVKQTEPDTCLLDIGLPGMNGYELAKRLRAQQDYGTRVRLVALTGYGQDSDRLQALAAGFDEHLVKPVNVDVLISVLANKPSEQKPD